MKKILVIDESQLFREFLKQKLSEYGFEVTLAVNGLDGSVKLRQIMPDLVIMDYYLSRNSSIELLEKKKNDPNTAGTPVVMCSARIDRQKLMQVAKYGVKKFFTKPITVDSLLRTVAEILDVNLDLDNTPCIIEAHFNDEILFIEVSEGLNKEKIELLKYKISELMDLYETESPRVLVIMPHVEMGSDDTVKLGMLLSNILNRTRTKPRYIKVLTNNRYVKEFVDSREAYREIEVTNSIERAMDGLLGKKAEAYMDGEHSVIQEDFLKSTAPKKAAGESFDMKFETEKTVEQGLEEIDRDVVVAIVDDDIVIQELVETAFTDTGFTVKAFNNGREFIECGELESFDLVFLDLMMPEMNGFQVLSELKQRGLELPVIVLSALSKKETVVEALKFGVSSYIIKPLKPEWLLKKATEVLRMNF